MFEEEVKAPNRWLKVRGPDGLVDLYLCSAYMPQESAHKSKREEAWNDLGNSCGRFQALGKVIILGDLNAQLGKAETAQ